MNTVPTAVFEGLNDVTDYIANRVTICTALGASLGIATSTLKGINGKNLIKPGIHAGVSSALAMTACFVSERLIFAGICLLESKNDASSQFSQHRSGLKEIGNVRSHALGGAIGGAFVSKLYTYRALPGIFFFPPIMLVAYGIDYKVNEYREHRLKIIQQDQSDT